jgi:hypothetical protein
MNRERSRIVIRVTPFIRMRIHRCRPYIEKNPEQPFGKFYKMCRRLLIPKGERDAAVGRDACKGEGCKEFLPTGKCILCFARKAEGPSIFQGSAVGSVD